MGRLLIDTIPFTMTEKINESLEDNNGRLIVNGVLQKLRRKSNGRVYPRNILEEKWISTKIEKSKKIERLVSQTSESSVVELKNTSHIIRDVYWKGDDVMGKVEILKTPGNILKELQKRCIGISSRGMGSVKEASNGKTVTVEDDFDLICWDFVSNPSTHGAFMRPMNESVVGKPKTPSYKKINTLVRDIICEIDGVCSI